MFFFKSTRRSELTALFRTEIFNTPGFDPEYFSSVTAIFITDFKGEGMGFTAPRVLLIIASMSMFPTSVIFLALQRRLCPRYRDVQGSRGIPPLVLNLDSRGR